MLWCVGQRQGLSLFTKSSIGFAEIRLTDDAVGATPIRVNETIRLPRDLLDALGSQSAQYPLAIVLTRETTMDDNAVAVATTRLK